MTDEIATRIVAAAEFAAIADAARCLVFAFFRHGVVLRHQSAPTISGTVSVTTAAAAAILAKTMAP